MSKNVAEYFACDVFNDEVMKARLPKAVYKALTKTRKLGVPLDPTYADVVANALKDWAIEHGATHYTHWFQPMTGAGMQNLSSRRTRSRRNLPSISTSTARARV